MPERVQLRRTKGWRMPKNTVKVDRTTQWGNPFKNHPADVLVELFRVAVGQAMQKGETPEWVHERFVDPCEMDAPLSDPGIWLGPLRGRNLACWCALPEPGKPDLCHAAVLLELANPLPSPPQGGADG